MKIKVSPLLFTSGSKYAARKRCFLFLILILGSTILLSGRGYAANCTQSTQNTSANFNNVNVEAGVAVGQSITGDIRFSKVQFARCEASMTWSKTFSGGIYASLSPAGTYNGRVAFKTNVPGIGVQFGGEMDVGSTPYSRWITVGTSVQAFSDWSIGWGATFPIYFTPALNLIKISNDVQSGTLSGTVGYAKTWGNEGSAMLNVNLMGTVTASGCKIFAGKSMTLQLADAQRINLPGVGSIWGQSSEKSLTLSCNAGTRVHITFLGTQSSETTENTVLQNEGTAKGVGVQLIDRHDGTNNPISLGYRWTAIDNSGTTVSIPIAARYKRTGSLTAGTVKVNATYVLDYD